MSITFNESMVCPAGAMVRGSVDSEIQERDMNKKGRRVARKHSKTRQRIKSKARAMRANSKKAKK